MAWSLHTLPVDLVYRILDNLDPFSMIVSCRNVCKRLNDIIDRYYQYQTLTTLSRIGNKIGDEGAEHLANALPKYKLSITFNLFLNNSDDQGVKHLANVLPYNKLKQIPRFTLVCCFSHSSCGTQGIEHLPDALEQTKTLTIPEFLHMTSNWNILKHIDRILKTKVNEA